MIVSLFSIPVQDITEVDKEHMTVASMQVRETAGATFPPTSSYLSKQDELLNLD